MRCYSIVFIAGITPTNYSGSYIVQKMQRVIRASLATAIYDNKLSDCLLSRSQRLIGLSTNTGNRGPLKRMNTTPYVRHIIQLL